MKYSLLLLAAGCALAQGPKGTWEASVIVEGRDVTFLMEFQGAGANLRGAVLDGDRRIWSTSGSYEGNRMVLSWDFYDARLEASMENEEFRGVYQRRTRSGIVKRMFVAGPIDPPKAEEEKPSPFNGDWILQPDNGKDAMKARFRRTGDRITGTILRVDGDFGTLSGYFRGETAVLSHFDLVRATYVEMSPDGDGRIRGMIDGRTGFKGVRDGAAMPDPSKVTRVRNPEEPFVFSGNDLDGKPVTSADARFKGKAVVITIMGSWCPNCHDEAPFLAELYRQHKDTGLEVVALAFEYTGDPEVDGQQVRAFVRRHNTPYLTLLAGSTEDGQVQKRMPQLENFAAFPSSIILDRSHKVVAIHAGFSGPATGDLHEKLKNQMRAEVQRALASK